MQKLPNLKDVNDLKGKRVLLRASLNVPVYNQKVTNHFRIKRALPSIKYLQEQGAKVIVVAHIGRDPEASLEPVAQVLHDKCQVQFVKANTGSLVQEKLNSLKPGEAVLLENLRQDPREKSGDKQFAKELADLADIYVNDAFAASHREHASIVGVPQYLPSYFGFNFVHEYEELSRASKPDHPALFILGGAKFETKLPLVEKYTETYDTIVVGGALANDFYKAAGYEIGQSLVSDIDLRGHVVFDNPKVETPVDVVVDGPQGKRATSPDQVTKEERILDAGPKTIAQLIPHIAKAKTILWNGPLGNFEAGFGEATKELAKLIADADGYSIVGGGDTIAAIEELGVEEKFNFMSTAGGAMLTFLETGTLPAIESVNSKRAEN